MKASARYAAYQRMIGHIETFHAAHLREEARLDNIAVHGGQADIDVVALWRILMDASLGAAYQMVDEAQARIDRNGE